MGAVETAEQASQPLQGCGSILNSSRGRWRVLGSRDRFRRLVHFTPLRGLSCLIESLVNLWPSVSLKLFNIFLKVLLIFVCMLCGDSMNFYRPNPCPLINPLLSLNTQPIQLFTAVRRRHIRACVHVRGPRSVRSGAAHTH